MEWWTQILPSRVRVGPTRYRDSRILTDTVKLFDYMFLGILSTKEGGRCRHYVRVVPVLGRDRNSCIGVVDFVPKDTSPRVIYIQVIYLLTNSLLHSLVCCFVWSFTVSLLLCAPLRETVFSRRLLRRLPAGVLFVDGTTFVTRSTSLSSF